MATTKVKKSKFGNYKIIIDKNMKDYSDEPFFLEKAAKASESLKKAPIPQWILDKYKKNK